MTLVDLIKDLIDNTKERLKTPISSAFLWSFIVFNWRPIILLLFSKETIENKIIVINYEYCTFWAFFFPALFALIYTSLVPKLMLAIDNDLAPTKEKRVKNIYKEKDYLFDRKIEIARKEFLLKNTESGNKEMEELLSEKEMLKEKVVMLQETIKQIDNSNRNIVEQLNNNLQNSNKTIENLVRQSENYHEEQAFRESEFNRFQKLRREISKRTLGLDLNLANRILEIVNILDINEFNFLENIEVNLKNEIIFENTEDNFEILRNLLNKGVVSRKTLSGKSIYVLTEAGDVLLNHIKF